jgi:virginiamycin B lyase
MKLLKRTDQDRAIATDSPPESGWRRRLRGREGDAWVMLGMLVVGLITVATLSAITNAMNAPIATRQPPPAATSAPSGKGVASADERVYHLPRANPGLMNPAVDQQGRVWFGEMGANKLAMLDPQTGKVSEWTPPNGQYNIMNEVVDKQGAIWFTEEAANYIGRFDPATQTFKTYPLNTAGGKSAGPEAIALDAQGAVWFTEVTAGALGRLDPATGKLTVYPLPATPLGGQSYPYALTVAPDGGVWYGDLTGGSVGRLDPATGKVAQYRTPDPKAEVYTMTIGPDGAVWYTQLLSDTIGRIDPATGKITQIPVPATVGPPATLYSLVTRDNALWLTSTGSNALVRYIPATNEFSFFTLKQPQSVPFGLAIAPDGAIWLTADGVPNYVASIHP